MESASGTRSTVLAVGDFPAHADLVEQLGLERVDSPVDGAFSLVEAGGSLELRPPDRPDRHGIRAHFPPDTVGSGPARRPVLAKAFGRRIDRVFDLTAGLGADAYRLADAGYVVRAWERHPAVFALLVSGWRAALARHAIPASIVARLSFSHGDAREALETFGDPRDAAYLDPMYPLPRRSSALPKRALQVLRALLPEEAPPVELLAAARERLARVVVKRPHRAPPLLPGAGFAVETKLVRFDVYLNPARMEATDA